MKAVIQKVKNCTLYSENVKFSEIKNGLLIMLGISVTDSVEKVKPFVDKVLKLRIFDDEFGKTNKNIFDANGEIMLVSNFTLYGNLKGTNRPDFINCAKPNQAEPIYNAVANELSKHVKTMTGVFRTYMEIQTHLDGPSTYILEI